MEKRQEEEEEEGDGLALRAEGLVCRVWAGAAVGGEALGRACGGEPEPALSPVDGKEAM